MQSHDPHRRRDTADKESSSISEYPLFRDAWAVEKERQSLLEVSALTSARPTRPFHLPAAAMLNGPEIPFTSSLLVADGWAKGPTSRPLSFAINRETYLAPRQ